MNGSTMIKKINIDQLRVGMHVKELDCGWMDHPFLAGSFKVKDEATISKIRRSGIKFAHIDSKKGVDTSADPIENTHWQAAKKSQPAVDKNAKEIIRPEDSSNSTNKVNIQPIAKAARKISGKEEAIAATRIYKEATNVIRHMMEDVRLGQQVNMEAVDPIAERIIQSVIRNQHTFSGITRIKTKDEYTFMHCVSVAGLMVTFAKSMKLGDEIIKQVAIGGLIHDVGKIMVPDKVLNKPGKLTDGEFVVMKDHVSHSRLILEKTANLSQNAIDVALMHHEKIDGSGYPLGLKGDEISLIGKMSAIVDVYDALTSIRVYKSAWDPAATLRKMLGWCPNHFDRALLEKFIQCLGIYPVGSLVELESGKLGIVTDQGDDMLKPKIRVIYNIKTKCYIEVKDMDMAKQKNDKILTTVVPAKYDIDILAFL